MDRRGFLKAGLALLAAGVAPAKVITRDVTDEWTFTTAVFTPKGNVYDVFAYQEGAWER